MYQYQTRLTSTIEYGKMELHKAEGKLWKKKNDTIYENYFYVIIYYVSA